MRATAAVWIRRGPLRASLLLVLALFAASSCTWDEEEEDEEGDDDDDVPAAWAPERTPPGSVTPSSDAGTPPPTSPDASSPESGATGEDAAPSVCGSGVPEESAASCVWRAQGLCFEQAEQACACAGCSLDRCSLANEAAALDAPLDVVCAAPQLSAPPSASDAGPDA